MKIIELGKTYSLDLGSLAPVEVKAISFTEKGVMCKYLNSWSGRIEELDYDLFKMNGYNKPTSMSNTEENQNALELLKQALKFYADSNNYKQTQSVANNYELFSMIEMDGGSQARFALEQLEKIRKINESAEEEFVKNLSGAIEANEPMENLEKIINDFKNLTENQ